MTGGGGLVSGLLLLLGLVAVILAAIAVRHRLALRIGVRNVARGRRRTVILIGGLLIATSIIAGSLVVGDTIDTLVVHYTVLAVGHVDESISNTSTAGLGAFPYAVYTGVDANLRGSPSIVGMTPEIVSRVSVMDRTSGVPQPNLFLIGVNANQSSPLGSFVSDSGATVVGPAPAEVLLDNLAASELNASAGDTIWAYGASSHPTVLTVQAVVQDNDRGSFPQGGIGNFGSVFVNLTNAQQLMQVPGSINYIAITNSGNQAQRLSEAPTVSATLNATLSKVPGGEHLAVKEVLKDALATEEATASGVTTLFLVLGLFSIAAGALLIVGIFSLLAEERKGEMGVLRAMGMRGGELVYAFLFEGSIYAAGAALAGVFLGVGVGYGLTFAFSVLLSEPGLSSSALLSSFTISAPTLLLAYAAGFLLTLATVVLASVRASRLNIIQALRDLPSSGPTRKRSTRVAVLGGVGFLLGLAIFAASYQGSTALSEPVAGFALMIVGLGLVAARFVPNRWAFTAVGVALLVWGGDEGLRLIVLGSSHGGGIYAVFADGITLVTGAVLVYAFNAHVLTQALIRLAGGRENRAPVARIGLSYPGRKPARTTTSLAIFALVSFTLVAIAGVGSSLDASLGNAEQDQSGGFQFIAYSAYAVPDLPAFVADNATLNSSFSQVVPLENGPVSVTAPGSALVPYNDTVYAGPAGEPAAADFYTTNQYSYSQTLHGMSAAQIDHALATESGVAVVDQTYSTVPNNLAASPGMGHPTVGPGGTLTLTNPVNGNTTNVTVLGIMTQSALGGVFVGPSTASALGATTQSIFLLSLHPGVSAAHAEQVAKAAFFPYGIVLVNVQEAVATSITTTEGEISLLQIFVALGLVIGIAAMGIVALRAVSERRREIGMLRANGFTEGMVVRAFVLEYSFITLLGLAIGSSLGLLLVWNLIHSPEGASTSLTVFAIPWANLAVILLVAYGLSMLSVASPSLAAARLPPATAVRASE
ncbi:MAG: ABC transporter permease [Thermoplasmata archaeon]